ncbi:NAD-dependent epimerase/dehydratase family protein [Thermococcus sp. AM4]|uniref:NAD-dependent epimerase/dehydratase family protein n=1 Tax=Thermococcus sp. (strain AM4) TaxID=246969 RepID=UPI0001870A92|nr:NAD-dependent epimerase/dehydratase family protein [Thermococcus sp. AM4]EEB73158.1 NAD-dependent epimerase/dehydratase [Thermococcus sp. AM4]
MILVFGGTGFIGSFVSSRLSKVDEVVLAVRRPVKSFKTVRFSNPAEIPALIEGLNPDVVVNFIGVLRGDYWVAHVEIPRLIAEGARRTGSRLIHTSALGADENSRIPYFRTKALGEKTVREVRKHAIVRPSLVLGPGQRLFRDTLRFKVFSNLKTRVQPIDLRDLAGLYLKLVEGKNGEFNACGGKVISLGELVRKVMREAGRRVLLLPAPESIIRLLGRLDGSLLMALTENTCERNDALELLGVLRELDDSIKWTAEGLG